MQFKLGVLFIVIGLLITACGGNEAPENTGAVESDETAEYQTLTIDEFANIVENEADEYQIINVHIPYQGEVTNTDDNVAYNDIDALTAALPDKDAPIVLYCRSGNMSEQATHDLLERGYTNVYDVPGGMNAWTNSGRELINN